MGRKAKFRKALSMPGLLAQMRGCFEGVEDEVAGRGLNLADRLMSGLAIFALKSRSLTCSWNDGVRRFMQRHGDPSVRRCFPCSCRSCLGIVP